MAGADLLRQVLRFFKWSVLPLLAPVLAGRLVIADDGATQPTHFEFGLIGDLPYSAEDEAKFPNLIQAMNAAHLAFVVHVGDIEWDPRGYKANKSGLKPCTDDAFAQRKELFNTSKHPLILTPGDNDWTDCSYSEPSFDPIERLAKLRQVFFGGTQSLGEHTLTLTRQSTDPTFANFPENVRWVYGDILFATVHVVGSNNNFGQTPQGDAEFVARTAANRAWLQQAFDFAKRNRYRAVMVLTQANPAFEDQTQAAESQARRDATAGPKSTAFGEFLRVLEAEVLAFDKPVVLVHGDTHYFRIDKPLASANRQRLIEQFTRVEVFGSPNVHWVRGTVDLNDPQVFTFKPEIVDKNLVNHRAQ